MHLPIFSAYLAHIHPICKPSPRPSPIPSPISLSTDSAPDTFPRDLTHSPTHANHSEVFSSNLPHIKLESHLQKVHPSLEVHTQASRLGQLTRPMCFKSLVGFIRSNDHDLSDKSRGTYGRVLKDIANIRSRGLVSTMHEDQLVISTPQNHHHNIQRSQLSQHPL